MRVLAVTAVLAFLAAAAFAGAEQRAGTETMCATIWQPVCAVRDGQTRTFANACSAVAAGWRVSQGGTCDDGDGRHVGLCLGADCPRSGAVVRAPVR